MNLLVFSDLHLKKTELIECGLVLDEISMLGHKYMVDQYIDLGDTFDVLRPESECLDLFAKFIKKIERPITIISANSHESTTHEESIINHYGILSEGVKVCKEYIDESYLFAGHFFLNESNINYGSSRNAEEFKKYKYVLLGHQHSLQAIGKNIMHLGACRYIDFAESQDKAKIVLLIENYKAENESNHLIALKSVYPMKDLIITKNVATVSPSAKSEGKKWQEVLDLLPEKTKVRLIFKDFESYSSSINDLDKYKQKFTLFKIKTDFVISDISPVAAKSETNIKESLTKYLKDNNINEDIKSILLGEIK